MRRAVSLSLAAVLLLLAVAPAALAKKGDRGGDDDDDERRRAPSPTPSASPRKEPPSLGQIPSNLDSLSLPTARGIDRLVSLGLVGTGLLMLALVVAARARGGPIARRPPKGTFEAARVAGRGAGALSEDDARAVLDRQARRVGRVASLTRAGDGLRIVIERKRRQPCAVATGYLTGLYESAWATDVRVEHRDCAGPKKAGTCAYDVAPLTRGERRTAARATRG